MAILDIRGTHGSGKSHIIHTLLKQYGKIAIVRPSDVHDKRSETIGYRLRKCNGSIVGRYDTACGGCDGVKTADEVCRRIRSFARKYDHVLLEGILVAHTFKRYSHLAVELKDFDYRFLFLDTPKEVCINRVIARRKANGNLKEYNPKNLLKDWDQIWIRTKEKCEEAGHTVVTLDYRNPLPYIRKVLDGHGKRKSRTA